MLHAPESSPDSGNIRLMNAVSVPKNRLCFFAAANCSNLFIRQSSIPMVKTVVMAALDSGIGIVFGYRSEPQMSRIDAGRIVAFVHDDLPFRDRPDEQFIDVAMRLGPMSFAVNNGRDASITPRRMIASPEPACRCFLDSIFNRNLRNDALVFLQSSGVIFLRVAKLAKIAAERLRFAKQAFLFTLFHGRPLCNGLIMTLP